VLQVDPVFTVVSRFADRAEFASRRRFGRRVLAGQEHGRRDDGAVGEGGK